MCSSRSCIRECAGPKGRSVSAIGRCLIWSDIPNNRMMRWVEGGRGGGVSVFRAPSNFSNGNTRDRQGRLVTCEHRGAAGHPDRV